MTNRVLEYLSRVEWLVRFLVDTLAEDQLAED
jgi:hypothetical protein